MNKGAIGMKSESSPTTENEIKLDPSIMLVSKTDVAGIITYGNNNLTEITGYSEDELIGSPHNILRHPDMPKAIFYLMWQSIRKGDNIMAVIKNRAKNGDFYWVTTDFDIQRNRDGKIRSYIAFRQAPSKDILKVIEPLYVKMLEIEKTSNMDASYAYLENFLQMKKMTYDEFIEDLAKPKGLAAVVYSKMKNLFN